VKYDFSFGPRALERRHAADVIHVRVRQCNRLKLQAQTFERGDYLARLLARIDAHGVPRLLAPEQARVLLKRRERYLLDYHPMQNPSRKR
jgi:hypothetical protein